MSQDLESSPGTAKDRGEIDVVAQNVEHISDLDSEMTDAALIVCKAIIPGENVENVLEEDSDDSDILLLSGSADWLDNEVPSATSYTYVVSFSVFCISIYFDSLQCVGFGPPHLLFVV